jgi:hypothetical protein
MYIPCVIFTVWQITVVGKISLPVKIQGDSYSFNIAESEYDNQISLSHTNVKEKGLNSKTMFLIKKVLFLFSITLYSVKSWTVSLCMVS